MTSFQSTVEGVDWEQLRQDLVADDFHNGRTTAQLRLSFENSASVALAFDGQRCIGNGRLISDGVGNALIVDVWTHSGFRRRGIGRKMMSMLVASVPGQHIFLQSDDAVGFYEKLGFRKQPESLSIISGTYLQNETRR